MRKIYSLVLMAAALFVGTNVWAVDYVAQIGDTKFETLADAFNSVEAGQTATIELLADVNLSEPINMPATINSTVLAGTCQTITLNLNGKTITANQDVNFFRLVKGTLNIEGRGTLSKDKAGSNVLTGQSAIVVFGAEDPTAANWSNLTIGKDVTISIAPGTIKGTGIMIQDMDGIWDSSRTPTTDALYATSGANAKEKYGYRTYYYESSIWPNASCTTDPNDLAAQCGTTKLPMKCGAFANSYPSNTNPGDGKFTGWQGVQQGSAFGVNVTIHGTIIAGKRALQLVGHLNQKPSCTEDDGISKRDTVRYKTAPYYKYKYPYFNITSTAHLNSSNNGGCTGIYAAGYGVFDIAGEVYGATGVYMKAGDVRLIDANIWSNSSTNTPSNGGASGVNNAGGSAIAVESNDAYAGGSGISITGDTKVTGGGGFAIYDQTYSNGGNTTTSHVTVEGGTIEGGITIPEGDVNVTTVAGGNVSATVTVTHPDSDPTSVTVNNFVPTGKHTTTITDGTKTIVVVSEGAAPTGYEHVFGNPKDSVNWKHLDSSTTPMTETLTANDSTLAELEINQDYAQTLTIKSGRTLTVGHLIMGVNAQIIVEAGAKLLVTGTQGMVAPRTTNLVLKANADKQATFVIAPEVNSNKQPNATVQLYTTCYKDGENSWKWQRFASPLTATTTVTHDQGGNIGTSVKYIDDLTEAWTSIAAWSDLKAFTACAIANNTNAGGATYTFSGKLMGNVTDSIKRKACKWNYYGNSFMAPMSVKALSTALPAQNVDPAIYYWDMTQGYRSVTAQMITDFSFGIMTEIPAMGFFVLKNNAQEAGALNIDYNNSIFRYAQGLAPVYNAPVRQTSNSNRVCISIVAENGKSDVVYMLGSDNFTPEYEAGADVEKLMNNGLNLYVAGDINLSALYTDNLLGATLTLQANEAINYTMTFNNVNGDYALRDNMTGKTIAIVEGATYNFSAQPNEVAENRFEIVNRDAVTTDINTIVGDNAARGIYTMMGQYVGQDWNALPAGVYVVDGVKVVK